MGDGPDTRSREEMNLYEFRMRRRDGTEFVAEMYAARGRRLRRPRRPSGPSGGETVS